MNRGVASVWLVIGTAALASGIAEAEAPTTASAPATAYVMDAAHSELQFSFRQAGAVSQGAFRKFSVELRFDPGNLAASSLSVTVDVTSLDTRDKERDDLLRGADLFDVARFPVATFRATGMIRREDGGYEARGQLRIRDVTHDLRLPLNIQVSRAAQLTTATLGGTTVIRRLDFGIGQGDWKSTEWVDNEVTIRFNLRLTKSGATANAR